MPRNELLADIRVNVQGWSQQKLARMVGVSIRTVKGWEAGTTARPQPAVLANLMEVTGVSSAAELGFSALSGSHGTVRIGGIGQKGSDDMLRRRDLLMIVSGAMGGAMAEPLTRMFPAPTNLVHIGASDVERVTLLRLRSHEFERMMGGGAVSGAAVVRRFRAALGMLHGVYRNEAVRQDMHAAVAHCGATAGWILVDHGEHGTAQRVFAAGLAAAEGAEDGRKDPLRTLILTDMARQAVYRQQYRTAIDLPDHLNPVLDDLPQEARAIVRSRRARALAGLGEVYEVDELSHQAEDEFGAASETGPAELRDIGLGRQELFSDLRHAFGSLAVEHGIRSAEAERRLTESIRAYGPDNARSRAGRYPAGQRAPGPAGREAGTRGRPGPRRRGEVGQVRPGARTRGAGLRLAVRHRADPGVAEVIDILRAVRRPA